MILFWVLAIVLVLVIGVMIGMLFKMQRLEENQQAVVDWLIAEYRNDRAKRPHAPLKIGDTVIIPGAVNER